MISMKTTTTTTTIDMKKIICDQKNNFLEKKCSFFKDHLKNWNLTSKPQVFFLAFPFSPFLERLWAKLDKFYHIWTWEQWSWSLISLLILYFLTGYYYNKWLKNLTGGQWLSFRARLLLIAFDLFLNLVLGLYYMDYRDTFMGEVMVRCPIAISPFIFLFELMGVTLYYLYYYYWPQRPWWINFWAKMDKNKFWIKTRDTARFLKKVISRVKKDK